MNQQSNNNSPLSAIREESDGDNYEDLSENEGNDDSEGEDGRIQLQCKLQLTGHQTRIQGLQELKDLYHRVSTRLTKSQEETSSFLKRAEEQVSNFLDEDDVKEKKELKVFEQLEQLTGRPSFGSKLSLVEQFIQDHQISFDSTTHSDIVDNDKDEDEEEEGITSVVLSSDDDDEFDRISNLSNTPPPQTIEDYDHVIKDDVTPSVAVVQEKVQENNNNTSPLMEERLLFQNYVEEQEAKLEKQRATMILNEKIKIEKLKKEVDLSYRNQISQLENKLKSTYIEWSQKSSNWNVTRTKMMKQIQELEKQCQILDDKLAKYVNKQPLPLRSSLKQPMGLSSTRSNNLLTRPPQEKPLARKLLMKDDFNNNENNDDSKENQCPQAITAPPPPRRKSGVTSPIMSVPAIQNEIKNCKKNDDDTVEFPNGTRKYVCKSKQFTRTLYKNGDIKEKRSDGSTHYFFASYGLRHYIYPNGLEMTTYKNGQVQRKNPDGTSEILYPNGCVKIIRPNGKEEFIFPDNTVYQSDDNGNTTIMLPNGQKEIHSELWKKRIFPDGTIKILHKDGSTETTYSNGRTRVKNASGNLIFDTQQQQGQTPISEDVITI